MSGSTSDGDGGGGGEDRQLINGDGESNGGAEVGETPIPSESEMQEEGGGDSALIPHVESKEDMFVDANEDIIQDGQFLEADSEVDSKDEEEEEAASLGDVDGLRERLEKAVSEKKSIEKELKEEKESFAGEVEGFRERLERSVFEKESVEKELKDERESFAREVGGLRKQLKDLVHNQLDTGEEGEVRTVESLPEMINECSQFVKAALEQRQQAEKTLSEFHQQIQGNQNVEVAVDRMMYSLSTVVNPGELVDYSVLGKTDYVERCASLLVEQYRWILHEIDQFRHSITEAGSNLEVQGGDYSWGSIFATAKAEFLELKRKETEMVEKLADMEDQNRKLVTEMDKVKADLDLEKNRCANAREKLNMAVSKGKTLIQVRDSLKQSLAEKGSELEKCLAELQEKSHAVEAAEHCKEELVKYENSVAALQDLLSGRISFEDLQPMDLEEKLRRIVNLVGSLQENVAEKASVVDNIEEILSRITVPEELNYADVTMRLKWVLDLVASLNETLSLKTNVLEELEEILTRITIPDDVQSEDPIGRLKWLVEDRHKIKDDLLEFQKAKDALNLVDMPESVSSSDLTTQFGWLEGSIDQMKGAITAEIQEKERLKIELDELLGKHEQMVDAEVFCRMQSLLYVRDQELMLCKTILEEDELEASKELEALREEKESMKSDLNRSEEKAALLREKLTLAVKKGKGLVQDRENLKHLLDEKKLEIEKLKLEIQQQESVVGECQKLEADLVAVKDQRDRFEQLLLESDNTLQKVMESVDRITLPVDLTSDEPVSKMKALADYLSESQLQKVRLEQELDTVKEEYKEVQQNLKSAESHISELEESKKNVELDLENALDEVKARTSEITEAHEARRSLEDALSLAENNIAVLVKEREDALISRATVEAELEKVRDRADSQSGKLTDAYKSMESLEDNLAQAEAKVALLTEENNNFQAGRTHLEGELKKLKDEAELLVGKLEENSSTVKSLEDALSKAMSDISALEDDKRIAEREISTLNSKLNACMDELAGTSGSLASKSVELIGHLTGLHMLTKNDGLLPVIRQHFEKQFQDFNDMDAILRDMKDCFANGDSQMLKINPIMDHSQARKAFPYDTDGILSGEMENGDVNSTDLDNVSLYFKKFSDGLQMRNKIVAENFKGFSSFMEEFVEAMLSKLRTTKDAVIDTLEHVESMKQKMIDVEIRKEEQERALTLLEKEHKVLLSACVNATKELQFECVNGLLDLKSGLELEKLNHLIPSVNEGSFDAENQQRVDVSAGHPTSEDSENVKIAETLSLATRKVKNQIKSFESMSEVGATVIADLQKRLTVSAASSESIQRERDSFQSRVVELESDVDALRISCQKLRDELGDCESILKERDLLQSRVVELEAKLGDYESISSERDVLKTRVEELQNEIEASRNSFQELSSKLVDFASIKRERDLFQSRVAELEATQEDYDSLKKKSTSERDVLKTRVAELRDEMEASRNSFQQLSSKLVDFESIEQERDLLQSRVAELEAKLDDYDSLKKKSTIERDVLETRVAELQDEIEASRNSFLELSSKLVDFESIERERDLLQSRVAELEAKLEDYDSLKKKSIIERNVLETRVAELQDEIEASRNSFLELSSKLVDFESIERERDLLQSRVAELEAKLEDYGSLKKKLLMKEQEATDPLMSTSELKTLFDKLSRIEVYAEVGTAGSQSSADVDKLFYIVDSFPQLQNQIHESVSEKDQLQSTVSRQILEIELLKDDVQTHSRNQPDLETMKGEISEITVGLEKIINLLGGNEVVGDQKATNARMLLPQLEKEVKALFSEAGNSKSQAQELGNRLYESQKTVDELSARVRMLEDSIQSRSPQPEMFQERTMFEAPSRPSGSEISEVDDAGSVVKTSPPPAAHVRTTRKGSTDHLAISIDSESSTLINRDETDEDKGRAFRSLNTSGLIPAQGKSLADRVDGLWVSGGRVLMSRPRARLGLIGYWLLLHIWVLATIL